MRDARTLPGVVAAWSAADLPEAARPILAGSEGAHKGRPFAARVLARRRRPLRGRVRGGGGGRRSLSPGRRDRARRRRLRAAARPHHGGGGAGLRDAAARGLARQRRGGRPREHRRRRAGAILRRRGRERALPPRAPRRRVHRDARRAGLSRSGLGPARPLVVHAEPVLDPGRRRAHRRRARRGGPRARARRRRRLRPQGRAVPGRGAGRPRGASPRPPGEVGREPARGFPGERPRPRAEPPGEDRLPPGRHHRRHRRDASSPTWAPIPPRAMA